MGLFSRKRAQPATKTITFTVPEARVGVVYLDGDPVRFVPEGKHTFPADKGYEVKLLRVGSPDFFWRRNSDSF